MESASPHVATDATSVQDDINLEPTIWELIPNSIEKCRRAPTGSRLNLVIPWMSKKRIFGGGPATAVRLFQRLAGNFPDARIVVTHETRSEFDFADWPQWTADDGRGAPRSMIFLGDRTTPLTISAEDYFLATFWSTAVYVKSAIALQAELFRVSDRRYTYLIQDYEPGFYPWSARYAYAKSTYRDLERVIAVFNTSLLANYFARNGLCFQERYIFEPMLHPHLRKGRMHPSAPHKERLILVYGRPSVARNDFDFVVHTLRIWAREFPSAAQWAVVSAGESHSDVPLGKNCVLRSGGQMTLDEYANHLSRCWAGLSFMFSAHPSYPPLEMAEFGAWVVTNRFANKDPSILAPNIIGVDDVRPDEAAAKLAWCCEQYEPGRASVVANLPPVFRPDGDEFPFAGKLVESWVVADADLAETRALMENS
jgi:O-antigen biosynthesis protein